MNNNMDASVSLVDDGSTSQQLDRLPVGLAIVWPFIKLGRTFKRLIRAHDEYFNISPAELKNIYIKKSAQAEKLGDYRGCVSFMEKAATIDEDDPKVVFLLGVSYEKNKKLDKALQAHKRAVELKPDFAKAHHHIGLVSLRKKNYKDAIKALEKARRLKTSSPDIYFRLGQAFDRIHDYETAIKHFKRAVKLDDEHLPAYKHMALTFDSMKKHKEALSCLKRAMELEESDT